MIIAVVKAEQQHVLIHTIGIGKMSKVQQTIMKWKNNGLPSYLDGLSLSFHHLVLLSI